MRHHQTARHDDIVDDRFPPALGALVPVLAEALTRLGEDRAIIIEVESNERYVQYLAGDDGLWAESISNRFIDDGPLLTDDDLAWLDNHGWNRPSDTGWYGNHWKDWTRAEATQAALAGLVTLHRIHGAMTPDDLDVTCHDNEVTTWFHDRHPGVLRFGPAH